MAWLTVNSIYTLPGGTIPGLPKDLLLIFNSTSGYWDVTPTSFTLGPGCAHNFHLTTEPGTNDLRNITKIRRWILRYIPERLGLPKELKKSEKYNRFEHLDLD